MALNTYWSRPRLSDVNSRVNRNDSTMSNSLPSSESIKRMDQCRGIHGAARERRGAKKATSAARRRHDKKIISLFTKENQ